MGDDGYLFAVGDDDQQIYSFRGAEFNLDNFGRREVKMLPLTQNYRSVTPILSLANRVIQDNPYRYNKKLVAIDKDGAADAEKKLPPICQYLLRDAVHEREFIAKSMRKLSENEGVKYGEMAVISRTQSALTQLEAALAVEGIPYQLIGIPFIRQKQYRRLFALLRVAVFPESDILSWQLALGLMDGVGERTIENFGKAATAEEKPNYRDLCASNPKTKPLLDVLDEISSWDDEEEYVAGQHFINVLSGCLYCALGEKSHQSANAQSLLDAARIHATRNANLSMEEMVSEFCDQLKLDHDLQDDPGNRVSLLTVHAAKGGGI